jgi:hypothetical protein
VDAVTEHSYEALCDMARSAAASLDTGRFLIGDIALDVTKDYGNNSIAQFAKDVNIPVGRVREYRTVCKFYEIQHRQKLLSENPTLSYSHLRAAMRLKDIRAATAFLEAAAVNAWTVEQTGVKLLETLGKPTPVMKLLDIEVTVCGDDWQDFMQFVDANIGKRITVKVYAVD